MCAVGALCRAEGWGRHRHHCCWWGCVPSGSRLPTASCPRTPACDAASCCVPQAQHAFSTSHELFSPTHLFALHVALQLAFLHVCMHTCILINKVPVTCLQQAPAAGQVPCMQRTWRQGWQGTAGLQQGSTAVPQRPSGFSK